jgi:hypothetical protein
MGMKCSRPDSFTEALFDHFVRVSDARRKRIREAIAAWGSATWVPRFTSQLMSTSQSRQTSASSMAHSNI